MNKYIQCPLFYANAQTHAFYVNMKHNGFVCLVKVQPSLASIEEMVLKGRQPSGPWWQSFFSLKFQILKQFLEKKNNLKKKEIFLMVIRYEGGTLTVSFRRPLKSSPGENNALD